MTEIQRLRRQVRALEAERTRLRARCDELLRALTTVETTLRPALRRLATHGNVTLRLKVPDRK